MGRTTAQKNQATSYGLTLVAWLTFSPEATQYILALQEELTHSLLFPNQMYRSDHLHVTLAAPLRGRYRSWPPIQRNELPLILKSFISDLASFFISLGPFEITFSGLFLSDEGHLYSTATTSSPIQLQLAEILLKYPELDRPNPFASLHMTLGYIWPTSKQIPLGRVIDLPFSAVELVEQVWLVHYSNRSLNQIIGKVPFSLSKPTVIDVSDFLDALGIQ